MDPTETFGNVQQLMSGKCLSWDSHSHNVDRDGKRPEQAPGSTCPKGDAGRVLAGCPTVVNSGTGSRI